ncbi:putative reverse transcriptase/RNA-dependent DNA polymerase [Citrus sinensis]|uniref:Reverse transcriptase/RNA-dependent DNA polymerase n=1 Tax=Citrus sinensis TaxID=2711 RepID=A0ACB8IEB7_CITSI|nr:putative reverse transcriptase/RNA-dependent DNA polymerase [Citrus sinensis]
MMAKQMEAKRRMLKFENCFVVDRCGLGGGLALLWTSDVSLEVKSYSKHHIDAVILNENGSSWRCTGIYGHPESDQKKHTWSLLRRLAGMSSLPWLCFGDFNEIFNLNEKVGGKERNPSRVHEFRQAVRDCRLLDLGLKGYPFTWSNRRFGPQMIEERLDRFFCNQNWGSLYQETAAKNLISWSSDHSPILMELIGKEMGQRYKRRTVRRVHYEDMWSGYEKCREIVKQEWQKKSRWNEENPVELFNKKARESLGELQLWSKKEFGGRQKQLEQLQNKLKSIRHSFSHYDCGDELKKTENQIDNILQDEEIFWKQRSRADWLKEGDKNTKFFHAKASARRKKNRIGGILDEQGKWTEDSDEVERIFCEHFTTLFSTTAPTAEQMDAAFKDTSAKVNEEMNFQLDAPFMEEEIVEALAQMCPTKAPGPDGLPAAFFQKHWGSVKEGVITTCLHILNDKEVFSNMLIQADQNQIIHGLRFNSSLSISHLLFADDSLVFARATQEDCSNLKCIFDRYGSASGQIFNYEKSSMLFSSNVHNSQIEIIKGIFQLNVVSKHNKYLGLPSMVGRRKISFFNETKLRIWNKLSSWQNKLFSSGGREVLIKAVAQAVPAYAMSVFKLPASICEDIQKAIARFWWGSSSDRRGIHWAKWEKLCQAKMRGGMGFRDFSCFNQALIAKQGWRIIQHPESLMARVLKAKYFNQSSFMEAKLGSRPSFVWRSILWGRQIMQKGLRWKIGSGNQVCIYKSNWLPRPEAFKPFSPPTLDIQAVVADLIDENQNWKKEMIYQHFMKEDAAMIVRIQLPNTPKPDQYLWHYDKYGKYSVKSGYQIALKLKCPDSPCSSDSSLSQWNVIWAAELPEKIKIFMWRAVKNLLPTTSNLWRRKIVGSPICRRCGVKNEDVIHALLDCKVAKKVWRNAGCAEEIEKLVQQDLMAVLVEIQRKKGKKELELIVVLCWTIWYSRNLFIFENKREDSQLSIARAEANLDSFRRIKKPSSKILEKQQRNRKQVWNPPPCGWFKINVDAAVNVKDQIAGLGVIIRNSNGEVVAAAVQQSCFQLSSTHMEAEAVILGIKSAQRAGFSPMIIETDSQEVVDLTLSKKVSITETSWLIADIQESIQSSNQFSIQYTPRECNVTAHDLAKKALEFENSAFWEGSFPPQIVSLFPSFNQ